MRRNGAGQWRGAVLVALIGLAGRAAAQDVAGTWQGTLTGDKPQRIVVKIEKDGAAWRGVVYNLDANMAYEGRATTQMSVQGGELRFAIGPMDVTYEGKLSTGGASGLESAAGTWVQGGQPHVLNLARVTGDAAWEVPKADAAMAKDADPDWDVVSVKARDPNDPSGGQSMGMKGREFTLVNRPVIGMLMFAYGLHKKEIEGLPEWAETERFDVQGVPGVPGHPSLKQAQILTRKLLEERFGLKVHTETKELAVYAITVGKGGVKLTKSTGDPNGTSDERDNSNESQVTMRLTNMSMGEFAPVLGYFLDRPAVDQTGLAGRYDFRLQWTADESKAPADGSAPPGLFTAIQEQLGLKLEATKAQAEVLVVDAVQRPGAN